MKSLQFSLKQNATRGYKHIKDGALKLEIKHGIGGGEGVPTPCATKDKLPRGRKAEGLLSFSYAGDLKIKT